METATDIEKKLLELPAADRERIAVAAWESLVSDPEAASNERMDSDEILLAKERNAKLDSGESQPIDHGEFRRITSGD